MSYECTISPYVIVSGKNKTKNKIAGEGMFKSGGSKFMIISGSLHSAQKLANVLNGFWFTNKV